jgi:hypothetical protein
MNGLPPGTAVIHTTDRIKFNLVLAREQTDENLARLPALKPEVLEKAIMPLASFDDQQRYIALMHNTLDLFTDMAFAVAKQGEAAVKMERATAANGHASLALSSMFTTIGALFVLHEKALGHFVIHLLGKPNPDNLMDGVEAKDDHAQTSLHHYRKLVDGFVQNLRDAFPDVVEHLDVREAKPLIEKVYPNGYALDLPGAPDFGSEPAPALN